MAIVSPPLFLADGTHPVRSVRAMDGAMFGNRQGVLTAADFRVTERDGSVNMSIDVAAGQGIVKGSESVGQGYYFIENTAPINVVIGTADESERTDLVVARVRDSAETGVHDDFTVVVIPGTPTVAAAPDNCIVLATVTVGAEVSTIINANINDLRANTATGSAEQKGYASSLGGLIVCTSTTRPTGRTGMMIWESNTSLVYTYDGSDWTNLNGPNSVGTTQLVDGSVTTAKLAGSGVTTAKIANGAVTTDKLAASNVTTAAIANRSCDFYEV